MKRFYSFLSIITILCCSACKEKDKQVFGIMHETDQETVVHGSTNLEHQLYKSLTINGKADLEDIKVTNNLIVKGALEAEDCIFNNVTVHGKVSVEDTKVSGVMKILGTADFEECDLQHVEIASKEIELEECNVTSIVVKETSDNQQLVILDDTSVSGNITFEKGDGLVEVKGTSEVKGKIIGGSVKK